MLEIVLDFETYYSKKDKYSLNAKGMTYEKYIRDSRFEVLGLAVKVGEAPTKWLCPHEIEDWLKEIESQYGWKNVRLIMHNGRFDAAILGWVYNIYPGEIADTMLMSRASQLWDSHSLDNVTEQLVQRNWGCYIDMAGNLYVGDLGEDRSRVEAYLLHKGKEIIDADGKYLMSFTDEAYEAFAAYGMNDVDLTYSAYRWFMDVRKFPEAEIGVMTYTIEMFTCPVLKLDDKVLTVVQEEINYKRNALLAKAGATLEDLRSDVKFAAMLKNLGVEPPTKINKKGEVKFAFAKKDLNFLALLDHENQDVVDLVNARLGNKSSQAVTRVQSFLELSARGMLPVPIEYYAAHTGRWGGCLTGDTMVLCLTAEQQVVRKKITDVLLSDLVWDGVEFVEHEGVKFSGYQEVITYDGITGTKNHPVFIDENTTISLEEAKRTGKKIMDCVAPNASIGSIYE